MTTEAKATSLKLPAETRERLNELARARDRSPHWLMKRAIEEYVVRELAREQLTRDAEAAWEDYQRTGLHVTGEEMDAWFEAVLRGENPPMPEPHT